MDRSPPFPALRHLSSNESCSSTSRSLRSCTNQSDPTAPNACGCKGNEPLDKVLAEELDGIETPVGLGCVRANGLPIEIACQSADACEHIDTPDVADAALRAASLLTRAAQHIQAFQAEQQRFRFALQHRQRDVGPPCLFQHSLSSPSTTTSSAEHLTQREGLARTSSAQFGSAKDSSGASVWHSMGSLGDAGINPKCRHEDPVGLDRRDGIGSPTEGDKRLQSSESKTKAASVGKSGGRARLSVSFNLRDPSNETLQHSRLHPEDAFARRLQQLQRRHLRELQRQQRQEDQPNRAHEQDTRRDVSDPPSENSLRTFTRHGLRRKAAALFKEAVRRGNIAGTPAEELKAQIGSTLYEAPNKKALEEAELRECTFRPKINRNAAVSRLGKVPWWERLHAEARRILEKEEAKEAYAQVGTAEAQEMDWSTKQQWKFPKGRIAQGSVRRSAVSSRCRAAWEDFHTTDRIPDTVSANNGMKDPPASRLLSLGLSPSSGSHLVSKHTSPKGKGSQQDHRQGPGSADSALYGRELLQQYLGTDAFRWLGSANKGSSLN